jgi:7-carboxy-7-deazaguanine synthase
MSNFEYQLKFVVQSPHDLPEILDLVRDLKAERSRVVLMPEGTNPTLLRERSLWLVDICRKHKFRYSGRLHVDLWGDRRGV